MTTVSYAQQTVDNPNPIARFAHRARMKKSKRLVRPHLTRSATLLDYGCGPGLYLHDLASEARPDYPQLNLLGYDPYAPAQYDDYCVVSDATAIAGGSVDILTGFEVCEHLTDSETLEFIDFALRVLSPKGKLLISVPIEIGPAVLLKEVSRSILHHRRPSMTTKEMVNAAFFAKPARRADDVKLSHRGYDWRVTQRDLTPFFALEHVEFSPFPIKNWYGQSQVFMLFGRR